MKKLKQMSGPYSIGFELSSTAHGFVATDPNGNVLYHGKQPVMGTRVFKEGQHAAEARMPRTSRRGIQRRRGREHEMERVFAPVISPIDPDFFIRRRMSYKLGKIRFESDPIGFSYSCLFHSFPTLAHTPVRRAGLPTVFVRSSLLRRSIGRAAKMTGLKDKVQHLKALYRDRNLAADGKVLLTHETVYRDRRKAPGFIYGDIRR